MVDIVCPLCGTTYEGLNLDETNGWFICTKYDISKNYIGLFFVACT